MFFSLTDLAFLSILALDFTGPVAQLVEQRPFKPLVEGSIPSGLTFPGLVIVFIARLLFDQHFLHFRYKHRSGSNHGCNIGGLSDLPNGYFGREKSSCISVVFLLSY